MCLLYETHARDDRSLDRTVEYSPVRFTVSPAHFTVRQERRLQLSLIAPSCRSGQLASGQTASRTMIGGIETDLQKGIGGLLQLTGDRGRNRTRGQVSATDCDTHRMTVHADGGRSRFAVNARLTNRDLAPSRYPGENRIFQQNRSSSVDRVRQPSTCAPRLLCDRSGNVFRIIAQLLTRTTPAHQIKGVPGCSALGRFNPVAAMIPAITGDPQLEPGFCHDRLVVAQLPSRHQLTSHKLLVVEERHDDLKEA